ncbi:hypothetical protein Y900_029125 [Mycolicibacterium aromaticivorans JS19b1 = JCM 16368]|uniref:Uncharacterized protein n=1 Tax=Mycolicibacterium aromaticivorans JS19b1 = JCM 16368 TaxID=1440774 RepID=A0A064CF07_9MYCO|nr:hypothetical protein [Mycolicibacterium aromaticivorans]KDE97317.1 hypothetical protein Y900_029125 [Mycolicibacterium aromaticivorans JS19b1 = JCM 16368]
MPVVAGVDGDLAVDALDESIGDTEFDGGQDGFEEDLEALPSDTNTEIRERLAAVIQPLSNLLAAPGG